VNWLLVSAIQLLFTLCLYAVGVAVIGASIYPGVLLCLNVWQSTAHMSFEAQLLCMCFAAVAAYFLYGICVLFVVGTVRIILGLRLKEGEYPMQSLGALKWALANSLVLIVSNTFMDFILLTPFANIFYRLMGARLGKNVQINSKYCADLCMLEIGDRSVIGGHATVIGHSFERGRLILKKVRIGKDVTIGLNSVVLPGADIGDKAVIAAGAVLSKNAVVETRSVFAGVPAVSARQRHDSKHEDSK